MLMERNFPEVTQLVNSRGWDPDCLTPKSMYLTDRTISLIYLLNAKQLNTWVRIKLSQTQWDPILCWKLIGLRWLPLHILFHLENIALLLPSSSSVAAVKIRLKTYLTPGSDPRFSLWCESFVWAFALSFCGLPFLQVGGFALFACLLLEIHSNELQILPREELLLLLVTSLSFPAGFCTW